MAAFGGFVILLITAVCIVSIGFDVAKFINWLRNRKKNDGGDSQGNQGPTN